jgi:hypothetical protein
MNALELLEVAASESPLQRRKRLIGRHIWAVVGAYGWRAGVICGAGPKYFRIQWAGNGQQRYGKRTKWELKWRYPSKQGKDKPTVQEAQETCALAERMKNEGKY